MSFFSGIFNRNYQLSSKILKCIGTLLLSLKAGGASLIIKGIYRNIMNVKTRQNNDHPLDAEEQSKEDNHHLLPKIASSLATALADLTVAGGVLRRSWEVDPSRLDPVLLLEISFRIRGFWAKSY